LAAITFNLPGGNSLNSPNKLALLLASLALLDLEVCAITSLYYLFHLSSRNIPAGAFGQNQQQQPAANPMFGNLGTPSTTAGTSGGFGECQ
jgi:hypothetical protein